MSDPSQQVYRALITFYGGEESATADQREHVAWMTRAVVAAMSPSVHPDWLVDDDDHASERVAHADNWEVPS
jgi:hypothetical protein